MKRYYFIVGEASGDLHAANLIKELSLLDKNAKFQGFGGENMLKEGLVLTKHYKDMAFMGFWEVLLNLFSISINVYINYYIHYFYVLPKKIYRVRVKN